MTRRDWLLTAALVAVAAAVLAVDERQTRMNNDLSSAACADAERIAKLERLAGTVRLRS